VLVLKWCRANAPLAFVSLTAVNETSVLFTAPVAWRLQLKKPTPTGFFTRRASRWWMIIGYARVSTTEQNLALRDDYLKHSPLRSIRPKQGRAAGRRPRGAKIQSPRRWNTCWAAGQSPTIGHATSASASTAIAKRRPHERSSDAAGRHVQRPLRLPA